jgi:hypothetical protein
MTEATTGTVLKADSDDARRYWLDEGRSSGGYIREVDDAAHSKGVHPLFEGSRSLIATRTSPSRRTCGLPMHRPRSKPSCRM